jgi:hypothetical protein
MPRVTRDYYRDTGETARESCAVDCHHAAEFSFVSSAAAFTQEGSCTSNELDASLRRAVKRFSFTSDSGSAFLASTRNT